MKPFGEYTAQPVSSRRVKRHQRVGEIDTRDQNREAVKHPTHFVIKARFL